MWLWLESHFARPPVAPTNLPNCLKTPIGLLLNLMITVALLVESDNFLAIGIAGVFGHTTPP